MSKAPAASKAPARSEVKRYRVTGFQAPLKVKLAKGGNKIYIKGAVFGADEWPMPHVTIPNQLRLGTIEEVE